MEKFVIFGGNELNGEVEIPCCKNAVLPILAGCLLSGKEIKIKNLPLFKDVEAMLEILRVLGVNIKKENKDYLICAKEAKNAVLNQNLTASLRSSVFMLGACLSRFKNVRVAYPGGCNIGVRPIDLHINAFRNLNVDVEETHGFVCCDGKNMKCGEIHLDFPSVGATENIILATVLLKGKTIIHNCAREPEIIDLCCFLNMLGAKISGAGSSKICVEGVNELGGGEYEVIGDRIIAGTYLIAVSMTGGKVRLKNVDGRYLGSLIFQLKKCGAKIECGKKYVEIQMRTRPKSISKIETLPYPGFPTDLQAQMVALLSIADGGSLVVENLFEHRFKYVSELIKMNANIQLVNRTAFIQGVKELSGAEVVATDLRAGAALVLSGLVAKGYTTITEIYHIDRGYYLIEKDLQKLGANIKRVKG